MGWKEPLCRKYGLQLVNSAMFAGSNDLQVRRMHSHIINNQIAKDDIIIWQITSQMRHSISVDGPDWKDLLDDVVPEDEDAKYYIDAPRNYFSGNVHKDVLSNHPMVEDAAKYYDFCSSMEEISSTIILLNKSYNVLVQIGWEGALKEERNNYDKFTNLMRAHDVPHLKESYVSWALRTKNPIEWDIHPTMDTGAVYSEKVLEPILKSLGWVE